MLLEEAHLIKTGLRNRQSGCDCILEVIRQMDPRYLDQLFQRLEQGENIRNGDFLTSYLYLPIIMNHNIPFSCYFNLQNRKDQVSLQISTMPFRFLGKIGNFFCKRQTRLMFPMFFWKKEHLRQMIMMPYIVKRRDTIGRRCCMTS